MSQMNDTVAEGLMLVFIVLCLLPMLRAARALRSERAGLERRLWWAECVGVASQMLLCVAYRPQTNGKAERFIRTLLAEWAYIRVNYI